MSLFDTRLRVVAIPALLGTLQFAVAAVAALSPDAEGIR